MKLEQAINETPFADSLKKSAIEFGFDLEQEFPDNLQIIDEEDLPEGFDTEGVEYLEDGSGTPWYLIYHFPKQNWGRMGFHTC